MALNKSMGNMYPWCDYTWNPIRGRCPHDCSYCYMKRFKVGELRFDDRAFVDLGEGKTIFVGSSTDMWARDVPADWIRGVLNWCRIYPKNHYLFQTKNPARFLDNSFLIPGASILGTTLETNRIIPISRAPPPVERALAMASLGCKMRTMVSVEPIMDFDPEEFLDMIVGCYPDFVSIGADSKSHGLPEPPKEKVLELIHVLRAQSIEVKIKKNLERLVGNAL